MCNRYKNTETSRGVGKLFSAKEYAGINAPEQIYPKYPGMVVRDTDAGRVVEQMTWGFPRRDVSKTTGKPLKPTAVNNARDDKLMSGHGMWKKWFEQPAQRCLIPFTSYAEAVGPKGDMTTAWVTVTDQELPAWAGLWRPTDEWGDCYTGVMCDANETVLQVHKRMPVILHAKDHDRWLHGDADDALALVTQYPADKMAVEHTDEPWFKRKVAKGPLI